MVRLSISWPSMRRVVLPLLLLKDWPDWVLTTWTTV